jgi:F-type H+-transporting ATPase subunit b
MLIDWFTVGAQALNFIILVWLLKRFLYKPVLSAIDAREQRIAHASADADRRTSEVQTARDELHAERKAFDDQRDALLAKARLDAKAQGERLLSGARQAAESLTSRQNAVLLAEATELSDRLARLAAVESLNIARSALKDLADVDLEERISGVFAHRLRGMDPKTREAFGMSLKRGEGVPAVVSSFDLSDREKATIQTAVNETFSTAIPLHFETSSRGIAGIELACGGQRLSWTIADYLNTLEEKVAALLKSRAASASDMPAVSPAALPRREAPAAAA